MTSNKSSLVALGAFSVILTGCAARTAPAAAPQEPRPPLANPLGAAAALPAEAVAVPGIYKAYYVGQIIDPSHPELMYRPGVIYRQERSERWNLNPLATEGATQGVISAVPNPARLAPFSAEQQQLIAQQRAALELLAEENAELRAGSTDDEPAAAAVAGSAPVVVVDPDAPAVPSPAAPAGAVAGDASAASDAIDFNRALTPNSDGLIVLSPELLEQVDRTEPNPFVRRHQLDTQFRTLEIRLTGTAPGPRPSAMLNGRILNIKDEWEGFRVVSISRDAVFLQRAPFLLQIPIARERPVTVRIPQ